MVDRTGKSIEIYEDFVLGNVQHPILCAGKLLKRGWSLGEVDGSLRLRHEGRSVDIPLNTERNSLQCEARIFAVHASESLVPQQKTEEEDEMRVQALQGYLSKYVQELEMTPRWRRLPNGVAVYSDPVATCGEAPKSQIDIGQGQRRVLDAIGEGSRLQPAGITGISQDQPGNGTTEDIELLLT